MSESLRSTMLRTPVYTPHTSRPHVGLDNINEPPQVEVDVEVDVDVLVPRRGRYRDGTSPPNEPIGDNKGDSKYRVTERMLDGGDMRRGEQGIQQGLSSTIIDEGDSVLGEIQKTLYTPAANRYPLYRNNAAYSATTPSFLNTSYSSPTKDSPPSVYTPGGTRVYAEKVVAGDERHVSIALRAYAMSVVEEEKKIWHSPIERETSNSNFNLNSNLKSSGLGSIPGSELRPVRMFTEDEIVNTSQRPYHY